MSAAHDFRKERRVSGAHENDERTKGLTILPWRLRCYSPISGGARDPPTRAKGSHLLLLLHLLLLGLLHAPMLWADPPILGLMGRTAAHGPRINR